MAADHAISVLRRMTDKAFAWLCLFPFLTLGSAMGVAQNCHYGIRFCDNCDTITTITVRRDTPCTINFRVVNGAIFSQKVVKRPKGIYGTANATAGAYKPPPGFVGNDYFETQIQYERAGTRLSTTLKA